MSKIIVVTVMLMTFLIAACGEKADESAQPAESAEQAEPTEEGAAEVAADYVTVQHILIAFQGSIPGKPIERSQQEAHDLAHQVMDRAKAGEDFDALVKEYTDDTAPGIYKMANHGIPDDMANSVFPRGQMVQAFGDVGFAVEVGGIGLAEFNPQTSPFGWHIIKRIE